RHRRDGRREARSLTAARGDDPLRWRCGRRASDKAMVLRAGVHSRTPCTHVLECPRARPASALHRMGRRLDLAVWQTRPSESRGDGEPRIGLSRALAIATATFGTRHAATW